MTPVHACAHDSVLRKSARTMCLWDYVLFLSDLTGLAGFLVTLRYWLSGVKWIRMQDVKPQTLVETFEQTNYNSIQEYNVALITLLTYPVNMHS